MKYTSICKALYDYKAQSEDELTFKEDDVLYILDKEEDPDWWKAQLKAASLDQVGPVGLVPANYVDEAEPIGTVKALYDYTAQQDEELSFQEDDVMILYENDDPDWFLVKAKNGTIGLVPSNYIEEVSNQQVANNAATQQHSEPVSSTTAHVEAQPPVSVFSALSNANTASDEVISWSVNEYDVDKKKKKKSKGNLLVGNGMLCYGSETDKASPVRQYTITDISTSSMDGKNIHIEIADAARTALDFQAASKSEAKAIVAKIEESQRLTNAQQQQQHEPPSPAQNVYYQPAQPEPQPQHQYQPEPEPEPKPEPVHESEPEPPCEPRWAIALYDFNAEGPGELSIKEYDQVLVTDYVSSDEWWNVEYQDGRAGIVPATYVQFQDEYEADLRKEEEQRRKQEEEEQERQRREAEAAAARQRRLQEEEERRRQEEERARQAEAERQRKLEEEKRKREQEAKRQVAAVSSPVAQGSASPRRSQIPAPPPPVKPAPGRTMPSPRTVQSIPVPNNRSLPDRPKQAQDPGKPDPSKVRTWTDRTGAFKVEAQFLAYHNGKIRLHKINGVKIDVPVQKMCIDDLRYIEQETGERLVDDKSDDIPLAHLANKNRDWDWFEYFMKVNIPRESSQRYATAFQNEKLGPADLDNLTHRKMKSLGMSESHVQRLQRYLETNVAEPPSDDESAPKKKAKKTVTFGGTSIIEDGNDDMDDTQRQIEEDEKLARRLQEEFNSGRSDAPAAAPQGVNLQRRGTGRPSPNTSAPKGVNSDYMEKIKSQLSAQPLQPTPAASSSPSQRPQSQAAPSPPPPAPPALSAPSAPPAPSTVSQSGFADDAWTPRPSSSRSVASKPAAATSSGWSSSPVSAAQNTAPVPLPPRQRPTPPTSQQIKIDPQLLSQWTGSPKQQQQSQQQQQQQPTQPSARQTQQQQPAPQMQIQQPQFQQPTQVHQQPQIPQQQQPPQLSHVQQMAMQFNQQQQQQQQQQQTPPVPPRSPSQFASQQFMQPPQFQQQQQQPSPIQAQQFVQQQVPLNSTLPQPLLPTNTGMQTGLQSSGVASQPTGMRSWANATPDNPFGGSPSPRPPAPVPQQQTGFPANNSLQPSQVFASMTGNNSFVNAQQQQQLGYMQTSLPGDKYAVFKSVDVNASSVFNSGGQQQQQQHPGMTPFQQPQATGFVPMQHQQNFGNPQAFGQPQQQQPFYNRW